MRRASTSHPDQPELSFEYPVIVQPVGDGAVLVKYGKLQVKAADISVRKAAQILGTSVSTVHRYINEELLTRPKQVKRKAKLKLNRAEVEALAARIKGEESPEETHENPSAEV